jgi:vacuolar protein sorting-associated protein 13A/C
MNSLVIHNIYGSPEDIQSILINHYKNRIIRNVLGLFLSSSLLGNMNLVAHDLGTGFKDLYYKPVEGFINGPLEGGKGIIVGTASLLGNTAGGAIGFGSRLINTFSKSLLFLSADSDYIEKREQRQIDRP